ncbi:M4 family metallopeptidase [Nocardioides nematodiphilus]|uniref:M4 family metallopeptidase n=1 Tax=Nocardioides nematodiphilus TaxID=2849669 RepID=UPI001CD9517C|nr:M4 family metallopeptidase [Nocardioides nematodiphilus]MCA1981467.1 M4 family metallopeptidase [Nocardioides nematodiphilus]
MTTRVCHFIPPYLLERLQPHLTDVDRALRARREAGPHPVRQGAAGAPAWVVHTCHNGADLPGDVVRSAGQPASGDDAVDEAAAGISATLDLYREVYDRASFDGEGAPVSLSVHYERGYDNAYWDGTQLVFGDGDGKVFGRFTKPVDVLGHELTHAVTERTAGLTYSGQSGALNESLSDVFGSCVKQRLLGQSAAQADWLIGEGLFLPAVQGRALRDMAHPGTAYDDPQLGKDPQAPDMSGYVDTTDDNGGVHTNSGIPNRAFYLAAVAIGGNAWEGAGRIWYDALTGPDVSAGTDFAGFAAATVAAAGAHADEVTAAWKTVGVGPGGSAS